MTWLTRDEQARLGRPFRVFVASLMVLVVSTAACLLAALAYDLHLSRQTAKLLGEIAPFEPPGRNVPSPQRVQFFEKEQAAFELLAPRLAQLPFRLPAHPGPAAETPDPLALEERLFSLARTFQREASRTQREFPAAEGLANLAGASADARTVGRLAYQLDLYEALAPALIGLSQTEVKSMTFQEPAVEKMTETTAREVFRVRVQAVTSFHDWVALADRLRASLYLWRVESLELKRLPGSSRLEMALSLEATRL